eukprot:jgi/Tetstr1/425110/TSEL_015572.t1
MHTALKNLWASVAIDAGAVLDRDRSGAGDLTLETSGLRPADRSRPSDLTLAGWGGAACDYMIDFACVSSTTPTWSNDPRWCIPGISATEAEHAKLAADRASSAPVQGVHRYYPFVVEDRGRLGKSALTVVYIFAVLLALHVADVDEDVAVDAGVAAKVSTSDGAGRLSSELLELREATFRLSQFAEFCHNSENISPLEATTATVVRFVEKAELIVSVPTTDYQHDFRALLASVVNFMFFARGFTGVSCRVRDVHVDDYNVTPKVYREKGRAGRRGPDDLRVLLLPVSEHPRVARLLHHFIDNVHSVPLVTIALAETNFRAVTPNEQSKPWTAATMSDWLSAAVRLVGAAPPAGTSWTSHSLCKGAASAANAIGTPLSLIRSQDGWATNSDVVVDYIDPNVLPSPGAWFFFGHIAPLRHFQVQHDSAAVAFPVPPS